jgi:hypothetical protein
MKMKRIFGYIFLVLAIILSIAFIGLLPKFKDTIIEMLYILSGKVENYEAGYIFGRFIAQLITVATITILWIFGLKWKKNKPKDK